MYSLPILNLFFSFFRVHEDLEADINQPLRKNTELQTGPKHMLANPRESPRPLDQGLSETCTLHAVANTVVKSLMNQGIDITLNEVVGALKQATYIDIDEGNNVEEFHGAVVKKMTDKKTGHLGDLKLNVIPHPDEHRKESSNGLLNKKQYQRVLVYDRTEGDEETIYWVFIQEELKIIGQLYFFCINSWGNFEKNPTIEVDREGNVVHAIDVIWTPINKRPLTSATINISPRVVPNSTASCEEQTSEADNSNCSLM